MADRMETEGTVGKALAVRVTEVGPRDGLQAEKAILPTESKIRWVDMLSACGFPEIEVSSFVSSRWVPQLADAAEVFAGIHRREGVLYSALVPNERGLERALASGAEKVSVFTAASETFSARNTGASLEESLGRCMAVIRGARAAGKATRAYVSCAFHCPFEGPVAPGAVRAVVERLLEMGAEEIDLADTIGRAVPDEVEALLTALAKALPPTDATLHFHDTSGRAIACVERSLALGVRSFDSAAAGLGGCPFAPGAPGNLATERLLEALARLGWQTPVDAAAVASAGAWMRGELGSA